MRVAVVTEPYKVKIEEMEKPVIGPEDVLIRVMSAGICGSDLHLFKGTHAFRNPPAVLGHEVAGEVVETGSNVTRFRVGDRVTVEPQLGCGQCEFCAAGLVNLCTGKVVPGTPKWCGTFAEYFAAREEITYKLAEGVSYELGTLAEPLAVAVHAIRRLDLSEKNSIAILGSGTIGLLCLVVSKQYGFKQAICTDTAPYNLEMAIRLGADLAINPLKEDVVKAVRKFTGSRGVDAAVIAAGAPTIIDQASAMTRRRGEIVLVAMITEKVPVYSYSLVFNEQRLSGAMTYQSRDFEEAVRLINDGLDLCDLVTHRLPMEETQRGLEMLDRKTENVVKIIVHP
ncbi:alcohol dehydrogenase catalytic domain-containing protein [Desulfofundulus thermobenzoicus]|uniref:Alcohol dehydrogenase catalytic domain-containing protein n=1 Tax=Desulfofundulus thermobenzoicus TaxID=29376 RepID=A0A6N7IR54_9FIRM|nr:alcohol dehydrogenase catalytic domain-containing protein [Desulfofundulus thermobenzoicus]MQL52063.1 alcohol dehydrogenase catalytic domain-containing protein [Desulfofundulus thermobenzoicus]